MSNVVNKMKTQLVIAIAVGLAAASADAQEATPGVVARAVPPPRPAVSAPPPRVAAPQARQQPSFTGPHGLGLGSNLYRANPTFTPRQFQGTGMVPRSRDWNRPRNSAATGVTPRVATVPQPNASAGSGTRRWSPRPTPNTTATNGTTTPTTDRRNWRNPNGTTNSTNDGRNWRDRNGANNPNHMTWQDARRRYDHHHHDRDWWRRNHNTIVLVNGGYYYWDDGWWYPAWGYDPAAQYYAYDGPIYGYDGLPPDQVIANVQSALQQEGYYHGMVDGELGPMTRQAIADWQRDHGLAITTAIDYPTLASLGLS